MSKRILSLIILLFGLAICGLPEQAKATHAAGGELIYEHITGNKYRFIFKFYRACRLNPASAQEPANQILCLYNTCTNTSFNVIMNKYAGNIPDRPNGSFVATGCSNYKNWCEDASSTLPGYEEWWYTAEVTLPLKCNYWRFYTYIGNRNASNNLQNATGQYFYIESTLNNQISNVNSSPFFSVKPIPFVCINRPFTYNNGAVDIDGDSLDSYIINPLTTSTLTCSGVVSNVPLNNPANPPFAIPGNPLQTNNSFIFNQASGQMSFTASQQGAATLTVKTDEYRNGAKIGSIMRDVQVQVLTSCTTPPPTRSPIEIDTNGVFVNGQIRGCVDQKLDFCFYVKSSDTEAVLVVQKALASSIPGATLNFSNQGTDSVKVCFEWTPNATQTGLHTLFYTVKDSTCRPPGIVLTQSYSLDIYIWPPTKTIEDTTICANSPIFLGATGGGDYEWSILPGGDLNSLSCNLCPAPIATPGVNSTYVVQSRASKYCHNSTDTVEIGVIPGPPIGRQNDTITCPGNSVQLDVKLARANGVNYKIKWTPAVYLNSDTIENPISTPANNVTYLVEVTSDATICKSFDTVFVDVLDGFNIENPDTAVCDGGVILVRGNGDSRYTYSWKTDAPGGSIVTPSDMTPTITVQGIPDTKYLYEVTASYPGCRDSIASFNVDLQPIPSVQVSPDASLCLGDTMTLYGTVTPAYSKYTYTWTPGTSLSNPNILDPIFTASTSTKLTLKATTPAGCTDSDEVALTVYPANFLKLPSDTAICSGGKIRVMLDADAAADFIWTPDFNISDVKSLNPELSPVTDQMYIVYGVDTNGCNDTNSIFIKVQPAAIVDLPDTVELYAGESYYMNPRGNGLYFSWFPPLGLSNANIANPVAKPEVNTRYVVTAKTEAGCTTTDSIDILVINDSYIEIPNAFAPGSGVNGKLLLIKRGDVELKRFAIYNRWGTKVFETSNIYDSWDGTYNDKAQPMGVYVYYIEAVSNNGRNIEKQGNITLIR